MHSCEQLHSQHKGEYRSYRPVLVRELLSSAQRACELADHPQTATPRPRGLHSAGHHSHAPGKRPVSARTALQNPPWLRATRTRQADRPRSHGRALPPAYGPTRLPGGPASAHSRQGRSSGGRRGRRAAERAASEPSPDHSTRASVGGPHRPTQLERLGDLESRRAS